MPTSTQRPIDDPAADAALLLIRLGLLVLAFAVPLSVVVSRRAIFTLLPVGAGLLLLAATLLPKPRIVHRLRLGLSCTAVIGLVGLFAWSLLSIVWTPFPIEATQRWGKEALTLLLAAAAVTALPERTRTSNLYLFPIGLTLAAIGTALAGVFGPKTIGMFQDADPTLERAVIGLVMLIWPAVGALAIRERWRSASVLVVCVVLASMMAWTPVALIGMALGALVFALATLDAVRTGRILAVSAVALILLAPAATLIGVPVTSDIANRFGGALPVFDDIAQSTQVWADLVTSQPLRLLTGHGLDLTTKASQYGFIPAGAPRGFLFALWYDLGLVGALAFATLAGGALSLAGRASPTMAPFLLAEIIAGMAIAVWGFDTTQLWWITLLGVAVLAFANAIRGQYRTQRPAMVMAPRASSQMEGAPSL